jgi:hypothetical protein
VTSSWAVCEFCGKTVDPNGVDFVHRVEAWERPAHTRASGKHGGSDLYLRVQVPGFAHLSCVQLEKRGLSVYQETLL